MSAAANSPRIVITYCTQCRWLLRATWLASELLTTFTTDIAEVALRPGVGGVFRVSVDDDLVWDRKVEGGFPDLGRLKRDLRDPGVSWTRPRAHRSCGEFRRSSGIRPELLI
jgi:selenoprotein W-related protein